jgi:cobalt/nickel transport system permease protein
VLLAATTRPEALVAGLARLRLPSLVVQILSLMVRYLDVVVAEQARMRIARESRGFVARDVRQLGVLSRSAAALFVRSYERGERVHLAMLSRGYAGGTMPAPDSPRPDACQWLVSMTVPAAAGAVALLAWAVS